jgi:hypothetical protein
MPLTVFDVLHSYPTLFKTGVHTHERMYVVVLLGLVQRVRRANRPDKATATPQVVLTAHHDAGDDLRKL